YTREELLVMSPKDIDGGEMNRKRYSAIEELEKNGQCLFEMVHISKSGNKIPVEISSSVFENKGENYVLSIVRDITERKKEEERYKKTIESSIDGFWITDTKGDFIEVNEAYCNMIGYSRDELLNMSIMDVEVIDQPEEIKKRIEKIIKTGSDIFESKHRHKKGNIIEVEVSIIYTQDSDGMFFVFLRDITERKQLESRVQQSQKMESIGTLAGGIAHDFNNILFPIVGHTEMLIEDIPDDSPFRVSLDQIYTGALRASDLVKQILTFSRQESGDLKLMKMQMIIKEALKLIRSTIPTTIEIKQNLDPNCGVIKADPTQIHQIVMNLSTNAYHAMEETGGELVVSLKEIKLDVHDVINLDITPGIYACLSVTDTGIGMKKELTQKIFDPFFTTKEKGKGTGMGLSVVHGIVISMNGAIQVLSEPPGKGTEFNVYLPVVNSASEKQEIHQMKEPIRGGMEQILLIDDEDAIITMEKLMLERLGYQVTSRTSSIEALESFRDSPDKFNLVITDMAMPNMPGDKLAAELIRIRPDIPILLCTGFSETMSEEDAASLGIKGFLLKPIVMKDLSHKIREVLDN
ncbi:MAG: PAS domain S-box protein, partial [Bacteroidales bacterium]|nr:PAS domain S-box protein [Bacteroidales bacterium]